MKLISICVIGAFLSATGVALGLDAPSGVVWGETRCELSVNQISPITAQIVLSPLDVSGRTLQAPTTAAFLLVPTDERLRTGELAEGREIISGQLRITIAPHPLTITVRKAGGDLVQKLVFAESTNGSMFFQTEAPVFGLGEGELQFDRRGLPYPMVSGQRASTLGTYGGTIPVPFLIGADGWSIFVRGPWGTFDLRGQKSSTREQ